jgi:hypothetical protein
MVAGASSSSGFDLLRLQLKYESLESELDSLKLSKTSAHSQVHSETFTFHRKPRIRFFAAANPQHSFQLIKSIVVQKQHSLDPQNRTKDYRACGKSQDRFNKLNPDLSTANFH